jgi:hypothetical protein
MAGIAMSVIFYSIALVYILLIASSKKSTLASLNESCVIKLKTGILSASL